MTASIHDYTGAYVLNAMDALEQTRFESHLPNCEACREDIADLTIAAFRLSEAIDDEPPLWIRAAVLDVPGTEQVHEEEPGVPAPRRWRMLRRSS